MDPFVTLTAAAAATTTLKIATGVCLVNQRDTIQTAKLVASIDHISGGRFLFGVGVGWNQDEMENHGTPYESRAKLTRERVEAMKAIWTQSKAEYHGDLVNFDPIMTWPKPTQKPHPPVIVGGAFPHAARRTMRYGDGWMPIGAALMRGNLAETMAQYTTMATEAGRNPTSVPVSFFGALEDIDGLKRARDLGVVRTVITLDSDTDDKILPVLDRWADVMRKVNS